MDKLNYHFKTWVHEYFARERNNYKEKTDTQIRTKIFRWDFESQFAFIKPFTMGNSLDLSFFRPDTVFYLRVGKYHFPPTFLVTQDINGLRESFVFLQVKKAFSLNSKFEPQNVSLKKEKLKWSQLNEFLLCSSKRIIPLLALVFYQTSKEQNEKLNLMTNCLDNFILYKNLCRDIEPSNLIVTVFLRKILTACSCLKQNLYENRMRHQLLKSC